MPILSLDFETVPFSPGDMAPAPCCVAIASESGESIFRWDVAQDKLKELLTGSVPISIANAAFDMAVVCAHYPCLMPDVFSAYCRGLIKDILIRQKLMDIAVGEYRIRGSYSLANLVRRLAGVELDKTNSPRLDYAKYRFLPLKEWPEGHIEYAKKDAYWHREIYITQDEILRREGALSVLEDENAQCRAAFALHLMSVWGLRTDAEGVKSLRERCEQEQESLERVLLDNGFLVRTKQNKIQKKQAPVKKRMLEVLGWDRVKLTPKGRQLRDLGTDWQDLKYVSIDKESCNNSRDNILEKYTQYAQLGTLLNGHVKAMEMGVNEPIHSRFEILMETGRTSSSKPNVQNVRRAPGARECFIPREGHVYIACDFDKAELHTLAQVCINLFGKSSLADALNNKYDPHTGFAAALANITYEEAVEKLHVEDEEMEELRQQAKAANFGLPGGLGVGGLQRYAKSTYNVDLSEDECRVLKNNWALQWPEIAVDYLGWIRDLLDDEGLCDIRHFTSGRYRGRITFCKAANSFFQGMAADGAKRALYAVAEEQFLNRDSPLYGCRTVNFIHDELLLEAPTDVASDAAWRLRDVMVREFNHFCPDVPVGATPCLMDRWSKKARTIIDDNGKLRVWKYSA